MKSNVSIQLIWSHLTHRNTSLALLHFPAITPKNFWLYYYFIIILIKPIFNPFFHFECCFRAQRRMQSFCKPVYKVVSTQLPVLWRSIRSRCQYTALFFRCRMFVTLLLMFLKYAGMNLLPCLTASKGKIVLRQQRGV